MRQPPEVGSRGPRGCSIRSGSDCGNKSGKEPVVDRGHSKPHIPLEFLCPSFISSLRSSILTCNTRINTTMTATSSFQCPTSLFLSFALFSLLGQISCVYCTSISLLPTSAFPLSTSQQVPLQFPPDHSQVGTPKKPFCGDTSGEGPVRDRVAFDSFRPLGVLLGVGIFSVFVRILLSLPR